jgi:hypothetical protein
LWQVGERGAKEEKVRGEPRTSIGEGEKSVEAGNVIRHFAALG